MAFIIQEIEIINPWNVRQVVDDVLKGFNNLYTRIINQIKRPANTFIRYYRMVLLTATLAYRPF